MYTIQTEFGFERYAAVSHAAQRAVTLAQSFRSKVSICPSINGQSKTDELIQAMERALFGEK